VIEFIIGTLAIAAALIVSLSCVVWISRKKHRSNEQIVDKPPLQAEPWMNPKWKPWHQAIFGLIVGGVAFATISIWLMDEISFRLNASPVVEARIEDVESSFFKNRQIFYVDVSFDTAQGQRIITRPERDGFASYGSYTTPPMIGSTIRIEYDTRDPTYVRDAKVGWSVLNRFIVLDGVLLVIGCFGIPALLRHLRDARQRH
jgi:hypothetical protein